MTEANEIALLIEPHIPALRRYAFGLTQDHAAADDLVQDCLERAVGRWVLRRRDGDVGAWLFRILHNLFIDGLRQERRRGRHEMLENHDGSATGGQEGALLGRDLERCLKALSEEQRAVLLLIGVEGFSYERAAEVLGIPIGTVMSRLSRAREHFRRLLEGERPQVLRRVK
jgi:RNA polymerase sigma-70 factor (ECF subfamily)